MGDVEEDDKFYRVLLASGVAHRFGGTDPVPIDSMAAVIDWVEKSKAPNSIHGATRDEANKRTTRKLCKWPVKAAYNGTVNPKTAASWSYSTAIQG